MDKKNFKKINIESDFKRKNVKIEESGGIKTSNDTINIEVMKENIDCNIACNKSEKVVPNKKNNSELSDKPKEDEAMADGGCTQAESWRCYENPISSDAECPNHMTYTAPFLPSFNPALFFTPPFQPRFQNFNLQISPQSLHHKVDHQVQQQMFQKMVQHQDCFSQQLHGQTDTQLQFYWFQQYLQQHQPHMFDLGMLYNKSIQQNQQYFTQQDRQKPHSFDEQMDFTRQLQQHYQQYFNKVSSEHKQKQLQQQQNDHLLLTPLNITIPPQNTQPIDARAPNEAKGKHSSSSSVCTDENVANSSFSISYLLSPMSDKNKSEATSNVERSDDARNKIDGEVVETGDGACTAADALDWSKKLDSKKVTSDNLTTETKTLNKNNKNHEKSTSNNIGLKNEKSSDKSNDGELKEISQTLDLKSPFSCISIRGPSGQYELKADKPIHTCHNNAKTNANEKKVFASTYLPEVLQDATKALSLTTTSTTSQPSNISIASAPSIKDSNNSNLSNVKISSKRTKNAKCLPSKTVLKNDSKQSQCPNKEKHNTSTKKSSPRSKTGKHESPCDVPNTSNDVPHDNKSTDQPSKPQLPSHSQNSVIPFQSSIGFSFTVSSDNKTSSQQNPHSYESPYNTHNHHKHCNHTHISEHNKLLPKNAQSKASSSTIPVGVAKALQRKSSSREKEKISNPINVPSISSFPRHSNTKDPSVDNPMCFNNASFITRVNTQANAKDVKTQNLFATDSHNTNLLAPSNNKINSTQFNQTNNYIINDNNNAIDLTKTSLIAKNSLEHNRNNCSSNITENNHDSQDENVSFECSNIENCHTNSQLVKAESNDIKDMEISKSFWVLPVDLSVNKASETENKNTDLKTFDQSPSKFTSVSSTELLQQSSASLVKFFPKTNSSDKNSTINFLNDISTQHSRSFQLSSPRFVTSSASLNFSTSSKPNNFYTPSKTQLIHKTLNSKADFPLGSRSFYQNKNVNIFDYGGDQGHNKESHTNCSIYQHKFQNSHIFNPSIDFSNLNTLSQNTHSHSMNKINSFSTSNCESLSSKNNTNINSFVDKHLGQSTVDRASSPIHELSFLSPHSSSAQSKTSTKTQTDLSTLSLMNNESPDNTNGAENLFLLSSVAVESNNIPSTSLCNLFNFDKSSLQPPSSSSPAKCSLLDIPVSMFLESFNSSSEVQQISTHTTSNQSSSASSTNHLKSSIDSISNEHDSTIVRITARNSIRLLKSISFDSDFNSIQGSESEDIEAKNSEINLRKKMKKVQEMYKKEKEEFDKLQKFIKNKNKPSKRKAREMSSPSTKNTTCNKVSIKSNNNQKTKRIIVGKNLKKSDKETNKKEQPLNYQSSSRENLEKDPEKIDKTYIIDKGTTESINVKEDVHNASNISDCNSNISGQKVNKNANGTETTSLIDITETNLCSLQTTLHLIKKEKTSNKNEINYSSSGNTNLQLENNSFLSLQNNASHQKNISGDNYNQSQQAYELSKSAYSHRNISQTSHQNLNASEADNDGINDAINLKTSINFKTECLNDNSYRPQYCTSYASSHQLQGQSEGTTSTNIHQQSSFPQQTSNDEMTHVPKESHFLQLNNELDVKSIDKIIPLNTTENDNKEQCVVHEGDNDGSNKIQNLSLKPKKACAVDPVSIRREELRDGMKVLYLKDQLFVEATIKNISPPEIYGVTLLKDRSRKPEILPLEELLSRVVKIVQPTSLEQLTPKTRVCAHWSVKFSCFYPGTIEEDENDEGNDDEEDENDNDKKEKNLKEEKEKKTRGRKPKINKDINILQNAKKSHNNDDNNSETTNKTDVENASVGSSGSKKNKIVKKELKDFYVNIDFDDEDSGKFPIDFIRLLPKNFPIQKVEDKKDVITRKKKLSKYKNKTETKLENINVKNNKKDLVSIKSEFGEMIRDKSDKKEFSKNKHKNKLANSNNNSMNRFWRKRKVLNQNTLEKKKVKTFKQTDCRGFSKYEKNFKVNLNETIDQNTSDLVDDVNDNSIDHNKFQANSAITFSKCKQNASSSLTSSSETLSNLSISSTEKKFQLRATNEEFKTQNITHPPEHQTMKGLVAKRRKQSPSPFNMKSLAKISAGMSSEWDWQGPSIKRQVSRSKTKKAFYNAIRRGNELIELGDSVVFVSNGKSMLKFVGRVQSLWQTGDRMMKVRVRWYYHPEETRGGNQILETKRALFQSCHEDDNDVQTISHKCKVLSYQEFKTLLDQQTPTKNSSSTQQSLQSNFGQQRLSEKSSTKNHGFKQITEYNFDKKTNEDELKGHLNTNNNLNDVYYLAGTYEPTKNIIHFEPGVPLLKNNIGNYN